MGGGVNSQCSNWMGRVRAYDGESMKSISLGSHNLTKFNRISSSICVKGFSCNMAYGSGRTLHIAGELASFRIFENNSRIQASLEQACTTLLTRYLNLQQLRPESSICNPRNFQVY